MHAKEKPYKCEECDQSFKLANTLKVHKMLHPEKKLNKSKDSDKFFEDTPFLQTQTMCKECQEYFTDIGSFDNHMKIHNKKKPQKCARCENVFPHIIALDNNMMLHKEQKQETRTESDQFSIETRILITHRECPDCTQVFVNMADLESHMVICMKEKHSWYSEQKLQFLLTKHNTCTICQKKVKGSFGQMNRHMKIHSGKKPHTCPKCKKSFMRSGHLKSHLIVHIEDRIPHKERETPHKCDQCDQSFALQCYLRRHIKRHEAMKTFFNCKSCPFVCKKQNILQNHTLSHTGHKCLECEKYFASTSSLERHNWVHVKDKPLKCTKCEKSYGQTVLFKRHILTHIGDKKRQFKCKHGPSEVRDLDNIFEHIHVGTHPYACNMCIMKFRGLPGLESHILSHASTK